MSHRLLNIFESLTVEEFKKKRLAPSYSTFGCRGAAWVRMLWRARIFSCIPIAMVSPNPRRSPARYVHMSICHCGLPSPLASLEGVLSFEQMTRVSFFADGREAARTVSRYSVYGAKTLCAWFPPNHESFRFAARLPLVAPANRECAAEIAVACRPFRRGCRHRRTRVAREARGSSCASALCSFGECAWTGRGI